MPVDQTSKVVSLRLLIENFVVEVANNPQMISSFSPEHTQLIELLRQLARSDAGTFQVVNKGPPQMAGEGNSQMGGQFRGGYHHGNNRG